MDFCSVVYIVVYTFDELMRLNIHDLLVIQNEYKYSLEVIVFLLDQSLDNTLA